MKEEYIVTLCQPDALVNNDNFVDYKTLAALIDNCDEFIMGTTTCNKCKEGHYLTDNNNCCPWGSYLNGKYCRDISNLMDNCNSVDVTNKKCLTCFEGFYEVEGVCCPNGKFLDLETMTCSVEFENCSTYDVVAQACLKCEDGHYMNKHHCCPHSYYFDEVSKTCKLLSGQGYESCLEIDDNDDCILCSTVHDDVYKHKGRCCRFQTYWNGVDCVPSTDQTLYLDKCKTFDQFNFCLECIDDYYLNNHFCCPEG